LRSLATFAGLRIRKHGPPGFLSAEESDGLHQDGTLDRFMTDPVSMRHSCK